MTPAPVKTEAISNGSGAANPGAYGTKPLRPNPNTSVRANDKRSYERAVIKVNLGRCGQTRKPPLLWGEARLIRLGD